MIKSLTTGWHGESVIAVPPLCRNIDFSLNGAENAKLVRSLEIAGVRTLLYGGNANFYHLPPSEYAHTLSLLAQLAGPQTLVIPSAGPAYGLMIEQARILRNHPFPTVMILPQQGITTSDGVEAGVRKFAEIAGFPVILYIKDPGYIEVENAASLAKAGVLSGIKYAIVRPDPTDDPYLKKLVEHVDPKMIVSGIGEQPAIVHVRDFKLAGFTSGCVCVGPNNSTKLLTALRRREYAAAEKIRAVFKPLEDLRNAINPIRVLHEAVRLVGIADTGPLLPLLSNLEQKHHYQVAAAAKSLLQAETAH
jgi:dihydrodipicolinate synthase/N-acetylneuraminate lyase